MAEKNTNNNLPNNPQTIMNIIERGLSIVNRNGLWKIFKAVIAFLLIFWSVYLTFNPHIIVNKFNEIETQQHRDAMDRRMHVTPEIRIMLKDLVNTLDASRAFIMEMHNGNTNTSGLPFAYCSMKYEENAKGILDIDSEYQNISLSRFKFFDVLLTKGVWIGTTDELINIDPKLGNRIKLNDSEYIALVIINGTDNDIGFLGVSFTNVKPQSSYDLIVKELRSTSAKLSIKLDKVENE